MKRDASRKRAAPVVMRLDHFARCNPLARLDRAGRQTRRAPWDHRGVTPGHWIGSPSTHLRRRGLADAMTTSLGMSIALHVEVVMRIHPNTLTATWRRGTARAVCTAWCVALATLCPAAGRAHTAAATLVKNIAPDADSSDPVALTNVGGTLFFTASDGVQQILWKSDGTPAGTVNVTALWGFAPEDPDPLFMQAVGGTLFFSARFSDLWRSDGTRAGTLPLLHLPADSPSGSLWELGASGGQLFFSV